MTRTSDGHTASPAWVRGRVVVVTGAASGIGLALVDAFAGLGAQVVMADVDERRLGDESRRLRERGATVVDVVTDVSSRRDVDALADRTLSAFGRADVLVNNAGTIAFGPAWEIEPDDWERVIGVNLRSVVYATRAFVPRMRDNGDDGVIVNVASMAAFTTYASVAPYLTTKHAVVGFSEALAADLAGVGSGISVSLVCPGMVATRFGQPDAVMGPEDDLPSGVLPARVVADIVLRDAIEARHPYVFTHGDSVLDVRQRFQRVLADEPES